MIKDVFKSITRGFGYSLGKLLFFGLLGLIAFIIGSKAYALETYTITAIEPTDLELTNTLGYSHTNYNSTQTYNFIKEQINDNSIDFNYIVIEESEGSVMLYIQVKSYFESYYSSDTNKFALFNYLGGQNYNRYPWMSVGFEYNMSINYNYLQNTGEIIQPLYIGDNPPYFYNKSMDVYPPIEQYLPFFDFHFLDVSNGVYWIPTFSNINILGFNYEYQNNDLFSMGPNYLRLYSITIPNINDIESGGGGEDNPPSGETGKDYTNILEEISGKIGTGFQTIKESIENGFNDLKDFFMDVSGLNSIINSFNNLKSSIDGIKQDLSTYLNSITGFFTNLINGITNGTCEPIIIPLTSFGIDNNIVLPCIGTNVRNYNETITIIFDSICYIIFGLGIIIYLFNTITGFSFFKQDNLEVDSHL